MVQRSALAGFGPRGWQQGSRCRGPGQAASLSTPRTAGINCASVLFPRATPSYFLFLACFLFSISSFQFVSCESSSSHRSCPGLAILSKDATYSPAFSWVHAKQVLLSFPGSEPPTTEEVKDSWAPAHSQGKVRWSGFVPSRSHQPWRSGLQRTLRCTLLPLVSFRKAPIPRREPALAPAAGPRRLP